MRGLLIVAASGLACEVLATVRGRYDRVRVLDDDPATWGTTLGGAEVLGGLDLVTEYDDDLLVCAGRGAARRAIVTRLDGLGVAPQRYATVVHASVDVPEGCVVGAPLEALEGRGLGDLAKEMYGTA